MGLKLQSVSGGSVELNSPITTNNYVVTMPTQGGTVMMAENYQPSFKNRIINGAMMIDQRYAGASVTIPLNNPTYTIDRWFGYGTQASKFSMQRNAGSVTGPSGFINYLGITSLSTYTSLATDQFHFSQYIEGLNVSDLDWGTANADAVTLSFYVRSSLTGTFSGSIRNSALDKSYVFTYAISVANTWTYVSVVIPGPTTGTWLTNNNAGIHVNFDIGSGSNLKTTANSWVSGNYIGVTGGQSIIGTNGANLYITGVQLEKGSTATSFDYRPYGTELALCQRYYAYTQSNRLYLGGGVTSTAGMATVYLPTTMRASPTIGVPTNIGYYSGGNGASAASNPSYTASNPYSFAYGGSSFTNYNGMTGDGFSASAEL